MKKMVVPTDNRSVTINMNDTLTKVRRIVKIFRLSPLKTETLRKPIGNEPEVRDVTLILDCKQRWNSLINMVERFLLLEQPIRKAMIDLEIELNITTCVFAALKILKKPWIL